MCLSWGFSSAYTGLSWLNELTKLLLALIVIELCAKPTIPYLFGHIILANISNVIATFKLYEIISQTYWSHYLSYLI